MQADLWKKISVLYEAAVAQPPERRNAFLVQACPDDLQLRGEVESLLNQQAGSFLEDSPVPDRLSGESTVDRTVAPGSAPGVMIGPYRLLKVIGAGGMGEVWLAEQKQPVRRHVALKLIKAGMDTREVVARFESERQALALMDHPAIAKVFDAGSTARGRPYFVMEYVTGMHITDYCDKQKLPTRARLELFIHVCEGVQHAHQKAIIHRDLKPSNILVSEVDGKPMPRIIDFGVAKATAQGLTEHSINTRVGSVIGTPAYMSPEQAGSVGENIDTRSDVYSLGVVLYELLVGALPFELSNLRADEAVQKVKEEDAPKPSTKLRTLGEQSTTPARNRGTEPRLLVRQLRGDLDAITLKAIEKERSRRFGSPAELAADIGRYLRNEPVVAHPPSVGYRARKYLRRNYVGRKALVAAMGLLLLAFGWAWLKRDRATVRRLVTERQLTHNTPENRALGTAISPDGQQLAYLDTKGLHVSLITTGAIHDIPLPINLRDQAVTVNWFPDGNKLLVGSMNGIWVASMFGGAPRRVLAAAINGSVETGAINGTSAKVSPDGLSIALTRRGATELWVMGAVGGNPRKLVTVKDEVLFALAWSPDGQRLAYHRQPLGNDGRGGRIETVALAGGAPSLVISDTRLLSVSFPPLLWLPSGRLIFGVWEGIKGETKSEANLCAITVDSRTGKPAGEREKITNWFGIIPSDASASKDGSRLAVTKSHNRTDVYVAELKEKGTRLEVPKRLTVSDSENAPDFWSRDGKTIFLKSDRTGNNQIFRQQLNQDNAEPFIQGPDDEHQAVLSPDGGWVLYWATQSGVNPPATTTRLMRFPIAGGSAEQVLEAPVASQPIFDCPSRPGFCILGQQEQGQQTFYAVDPLRGLGKQVARCKGRDPYTLALSTVSPDGLHVAVRSRLGLNIIDLQTGTDRTIRLPSDLFVTSLSWAADGGAFFAAVGQYAKDGHLLLRIELNGRTRTLLGRGRNQPVFNALPSPDGHYLAFSQLTFENNAWLLQNF